MVKNKVLWMCVIGLILIIAVPVAGKGPGGGGEEIPDIGELYGDLYVILRDENGVPMLDSSDCIQPISSTDGFVIIETQDGPLKITAVSGEPFTLATYTDTAGDLVECELTEDMAAWAQAVDFGRLNLGRAPDAVINHAFDEAVRSMNLAQAISTDPVGRLVLTFADNSVKTIDAPAENLALYIKMMKDGHWITVDTSAPTRGNKPPDKGPPEGDGPSEEERPILSESAIELLPVAYQELGNVDRITSLSYEELLLAGSLLAAAADKTGSITLDKVVYINSVYGINQAGSLPGEVEGKTYFDFSSFGAYDRNGEYGNRKSGDCALGSIWVLQADDPQEYVHFTAQCMEILGYINDPTVNGVRFVNMEEGYTTVMDEDGQPLEYEFVTNVRGFVQAADDALQVLEYLHNYEVPEDIYAEP